MTVPVDALGVHATNGINHCTIDYSDLQDILLNKNGDTALHKRFRALFYLKGLGTETAVDIIARAFNDPSVLLRHELAYVLGQMKLPYANPILSAVLGNLNEDPMVRHEAAEALGAIAHPSSLTILESYRKDPVRVVSQTCELAIEKIHYEEQKGKHIITEDMNSKYASIDPAPPIASVKSTQELKDILLNPMLPLFERYRAMFALRNRGDEESVLALADGFKDDSPLFRHEVAYVFGQMQHPASVPSLIQTLSNESEESMVRHECAEALGSIATTDCLPVLRRYAADPVRVVRESCVVGLDMYEYENSNWQFQPL
ncbi:hypothetical protein SeMB42_g02990 [Synchytrium endobioticum]|uniref:Deoxyhypusine hydroxylase n=1 Tax=Synchytrium endobioticum TaxID=286115 RepID=A0A507DCA4_9FUNG|nr:hypothetical protein SeMB42_g02990 [Synchytrium endobioticum]TPX49021.1 hypothetical protein SeLEV6574_g01702 [Synchytrium endobioticum]